MEYMIHSFVLACDNLGINQVEVYRVFSKDGDSSFGYLYFFKVLRTSYYMLHFIW